MAGRGKLQSAAADVSLCEVSAANPTLTGRPIHVIATVHEMTLARETVTGSVGLVPTMGYLHEGHLSLVHRAAEDNDHVVVSIFVNPTQFGPNEDFVRYPRDIEGDLALLQSAMAPSAAGALVFAPSVEEMYPPGFSNWIEVRGPLTERLEGAARPGHFRGVATVVARLLRVVRPQRAYFGQKDAQQLRVIRRMVADLSVPVEIVPMPTVREPDGLAMSSRNAYLSPGERQHALALSRGLRLAKRMVMQDGERSAGTVREAVRSAIASGVETPRRRVLKPPLELEYVSVSDEETFEEVETIDGPALVLVAARAGATRLIDNTLVVPKGTIIPEQLASLLADLSS